MTQVAKDKFNEMRAEIIKLQISKTKDNSTSNGHLNSLINVERKKVQRITCPGSPSKN